MRNVLALTFVTALATSAIAPAQALPTGTIAIAGDVMNTLATALPGGGTSTTHTPPLGFTPHVMLWDPSSPDSFIVGGQSFPPGVMKRVTFLTPTSTTVTNITPLPGQTSLIDNPGQLSWSQSGQEVIVIDRNLDQIVAVNVATGAETLVTSGPQPWGNALHCGAVDPLSGDIFVGTTTNAIYRVAATPTGQVIPLLQGGFPAAIERIVFDDSHIGMPGSPYFLTFAMANSIQRIDLNAPAITTQTFFAGSPLQNIRSLTIDHQGNFLFGVNGNDVYH
ncbi:MAG: hypothetical protein KDB18_12840, partial [Salinibacterium sp.]|nr:hypothetical protein [Salinibacterium sp.]